MGKDKQKTPVVLPARPVPGTSIHPPQRAAVEAGLSGSTDTVTTRRTSGALQPHQKHAIARGAVAGLPASELANMTRHTPKYIKDQLETPELIELQDYYAGLMMKVTVGHKFELSERVDRCYAVIDEALDNIDIKVKVDAAKYVLSQVVVSADNRVTLDVAAAVDPEDAKVVTAALSGIGKLLNQIAADKEEQGEPDYMKHVKTGSIMPGPGDVIGHGKFTENV